MGIPAHDLLMKVDENRQGVAGMETITHTTKTSLGLLKAHHVYAV